MRVTKANYAGACYGVQRALDIANEAATTCERAYTLGPLIHNPQVVKELAAQGVSEINSVEAVLPTDTVIIRSHGVTPQVMRDVREKTEHVLDATCPFVARAQKAAYELSSKWGCVVVVGEAGHPEVEGLTARAREAGGVVVVASSAADLPAHLKSPAGVVVQTTQEREALDAIVAELERRGIELEVRNTICTATSQRQQAAAQLARESDAIVVIGGKNSSNTTRLANICKGLCAKTYHIESAQELDPAWFDGCAQVGVTAGASTPENQIAAVVEALESMR